MRKFPEIIQKIVKESGLNLNNVSQASGISNGYLAKLFRGKINRPGKDKVASILLSLNYTITDINAILSGYDYQPLHVDDIPDILHNNRNRKIMGGNLPQYDHIYFDLLLVVLERIGGARILVKNRPSGVFMPRGLYLQKEYPYESNDSAAIFRYRLTEAILDERNGIFLENCRMGYGSETYICTACFDEYLERNLGEAAQYDSPERCGLVIRYLANALSLTMKQPETHRIFFVERCPYFHFLIQDAEGKSPKVSYPGRKLHSFNNEHDKRMLEGFTTDLPHIVAHFRHEAEVTRGAILPEFKDYSAEILRRYLVERCEALGCGQQLERELAGLMAEQEIRFY